MRIVSLKSSRKSSLTRSAIRYSKGTGPVQNASLISGLSQHARKKFACSTLELAKESFIARKKRQAQIHTARANQAKRAIWLAESLK